MLNGEKHEKSKNRSLMNTMLLVTAMLIWTTGAAQAQISKYTDEDAYHVALANFGNKAFQQGFEVLTPSKSVRLKVKSGIKKIFLVMISRSERNFRIEVPSVLLFQRICNPMFDGLQ
jgi:hypothetical protein